MPFLDWVNRNQAKETSRDVPYHLLHQEQTYGNAADNLLIQGDNLLALKALIPFYAGRVKCIFIDPPYNTQSAFEHYDDKLEHSQWLSMMYPRLVLLRELLAEDGSIWVTIDDNEAHYLKVLMDEVFGRNNFVSNVIWQKRFSPNSTAVHLSDSHDHVLSYAKAKQSWNRNLLRRTAKADSTYKNPDNDPRGVWTSSDLSARNFYSLGTYSVTSRTGRVISGPPPGRYWTIAKEKFLELDADNRIWWGSSGNNQPRLKRFLSDVRSGVVPQTIWLHEEVGHTQEAKKEVLAFDSENVFGTPKPERLIERMLDIATNPGDLILDSFLGSGTTAAVAQKMGRRWIGIEMGEHARTHCIPRLQKVIDGEQGGISEAVGWKGGGGFRFYTLGETAFDAHGHINAAVRFATLAAYVWHLEVGEPGAQDFDSPLLGMHNGTAYYLLYNGILGDRRPDGGNVLTHPVLQHLQALAAHPGPKVIYGESSRLGPARLAAEGITFKQIPYDIKMR
ncbi:MULTISPECIES: site-specific DNA-methyltransferase [unclassified Thiomonas]|uniref:site-specific DNA-methyltransferase n=1 Tax=unclassified Thiomonas TaxID=2625466 RepID=UPI0004DBA706|nr:MULTISPECIES: site-specific DNA-methyltransferase [unclassified Thiomonas]CDW92480.1 DNA methylase N-4/N-6 domain protein [Thiomonas sp. CB2]VDY05827.1 DNA methylase N-4/N-6 domain protein [Thiomonas sp. Bio17B3]VDY10875.1 DNA methylase N-4/N-6 domain protein [Thiomonas sp. Sup16B3]VDY14086.1 DNA methylase N-4/N-6 domain protein [Thiomonas sp. OC7]VDY16720.1 DNA methylase N-4/N-6 domain protein [Thiomonas sp. CB2]